MSTPQPICARTLIVDRHTADVLRLEAKKVMDNTFEVPLTDDLIEQLRHRRYDLAFTNPDRLDGLNPNEPIDPDLLTEITEDRLAAQALDHLFADYTQAIATSGT